MDCFLEMKPGKIVLGGTSISTAQVSAVPDYQSVTCCDSYKYLNVVDLIYFQCFSVLGGGEMSEGVTLTAVNPLRTAWDRFSGETSVFI